MVAATPRLQHRLWLRPLPVVVARLLLLLLPWLRQLLLEGAGLSVMSWHVSGGLLGFPGRLGRDFGGFGWFWGFLRVLLRLVGFWLVFESLKHVHALTNDGGQATATASASGLVAKAPLFTRGCNAVSNAPMAHILVGNWESLHDCRSVPWFFEKESSV